MTTVIIILSVLLVIVILFTAIFAAVERNNFKRLDKTYQEKINLLSQDNNRLINNQEISAKLIDSLNEQIQNFQNAEKAQSSRYIALTENIAAAEEKLIQLNTEVDNRTKDLTTIAAQFKEWHDKVAETMTQNEAAVSELKVHKLELEQLINQLNDKKETYRAAALKDSQHKENWFDFVLSDKEQRLINIIKEIGISYPELEKDLAGIVWRKVWLPKIQDLSNRENLAVRGVYRLVLKQNEKICYVGQAVSIKDRWYEHMKKMLGVDDKGNEKVYCYRPEDFYWTVIEKNTQDLNSSERYWIDYYCCKEIGLNKKDR